MIYLDHAATTPLDKEVLTEMTPYFSDVFGNPSSLHNYGQKAKGELENAREQIAKELGCLPQEIIFTSGGTESDNLAIFGVLEAKRKQSTTKQKGHVITSQIEHPAVLHACEKANKNGFDVTYLPVNEEGIIDPKDVEEAIREDTLLISIMTANNEIGTIQPITKIGRIANKFKIPFHTDAVQAGGTLNLKVDYLKVDLLTLSAHKFYGPKGVGLLYLRNGTPLSAQQVGGGQEMRRRASTENIPGIIGMAKALQIANQNRENEKKKLIKLRDYFINEILKNIPDSRLNGHQTERLPGNVNVCIGKVEGESLLLRLDMMGIACSSGSACASGSLDPSHVLLAIGLSHEIAQGSLRFSLGKSITKKDIDKTLSVLKKVVKDLRAISPLVSIGFRL